MIVIDYQDRRPLYEQICEKFKLLILRGVLEPDAQMPSVRALAIQLSINPNTIQRAYAELERQGYIYPVKGRGNFVSSNAAVHRQQQEEKRRKLQQALREACESGLPRADAVLLLEEAYANHSDSGEEKDD